MEEGALAEEFEECTRNCFMLAPDESIAKLSLTCTLLLVALCCSVFFCR